MNQFIDAPRIRSIILNEAFQLHRVVNVLAFVVEGSSHLVLAFDHMLPKLPTLLDVYRGARLLNMPNLQ